MIGRLRDLTFGRNREQIISLTIKGDFREKFDQLKDFDVDIEIKRHRNRRSKEANAYAWVLIDKIAEKTGLKKTDVYRNAIREIGGVSTTVCVADKAVDKLRESWQKNGIGWQTDTIPSKIEGCTNVILYYGSSVFDSKQQSQLISSLVQDAESLGIPTITEKEL